MRNKRVVIPPRVVQGGSVVRVKVQEAVPAVQPNAETCLVCGAPAPDEVKIKLGRLYARVCPRCADGVGAGFRFLGWFLSTTKKGK